MMMYLGGSMTRTHLELNMSAMVKRKYFCKSLVAAGCESFTETMSIYAHSTRYLCFRVIVIVLDRRDKNISVT